MTGQRNRTSGEGSGWRGLGVLTGAFITLGAAIDAGTFVAVGPTVEKAGSGLALAMVLAGMVALPMDRDEQEARGAASSKPPIPSQES